jgi:hypothetical protein
MAGIREATLKGHGGLFGKKKKIAALVCRIKRCTTRKQQHTALFPGQCIEHKAWVDKPHAFFILQGEKATGS